MTANTPPRTLADALNRVHRALDQLHADLNNVHALTRTDYRLAHDIADLFDDLAAFRSRLHLVAGRLAAGKAGDGP